MAKQVLAISAGTQTMLPAGTAGQVLTSQGSGADAAWTNAPKITGGSIDNAVIGGTTPAAGSFSTMTIGTTSNGGVLNLGDAAITKSPGSGFIFGTTGLSSVYYINMAGPALIQYASSISGPLGTLQASSWTCPGPLTASGVVTGTGVTCAANSPLTLGAYPTNPSSPVNGNVWLNGSSGNIVSQNNGQLGAIERRILSSSQQVTVSNTTTQTSVVPTSVSGSATLVANYLTLNRSIKVELDGLLSVAASTSVTVYFMLGGTVLASGSIAAGALASATNMRINLDARICCRAISGSSATMLSVGGLGYTISGQVYRGNIDMDNNGATVTVNPTTALLIDVQVKFSAANAGNTWVTNQTNMTEA